LATWGENELTQHPCFTLAENAVGGWSHSRQINSAWDFTEGHSQYPLSFDVAFSGEDMQQVRREGHGE
jgi:hypothetical protein